MTTLVPLPTVYVRCAICDEGEFVFAWSVRHALRCRKCGGIQAVIVREAPTEGGC